MKVNVYLPDDLWARMKRVGIDNFSVLCQRALLAELDRVEDAGPFEMWEG